MKTKLVPTAPWPVREPEPQKQHMYPRKRVRIEKPPVIEIDYFREAREQIAMIKRYKAKI